MLPIYLDHNASTPLLPEVVDAMLPYLTTHFGNPSSGHAYGRQAHAAVETARAQVAALINAPPEAIVFTSGGTEASALALRGVAASLPERRHYVISCIEHPATSKVAEALAADGGRLSVVPVDATGVLRLDALRAALRPYTAWLSLLHAHNETGVVQPVAEAARLAHHVDARVHVDASQSAGKLPVDVEALQADLLTLAAHKVYGPKGVGALYVRPGVPLKPVQLGAGHEGGRRAGTENVAGVVGFGVACVAARRDLQALAVRLTTLRDALAEALCAHIPGCEVMGLAAARLPNTLFLRFPEVRGSEVLALAPEVAASTGSACHDGHEQPPAVLLEMGVTADAALGAVRLTLGRSTTADDVQRAMTALVNAWRRARVSR